MNKDKLITAMVDGASYFLGLIHVLFSRIVFQFVGLIGPVGLACYTSNWLWLLLYIPFAYVACVITAYKHIGEEEND